MEGIAVRVVFYRSLQNETARRESVLEILRASAQNDWVRRDSIQEVDILCQTQVTLNRFTGWGLAASCLAKASVLSKRLQILPSAFKTMLEGFSSVRSGVTV